MWLPEWAVSGLKLFLQALCDNLRELQQSLCVPELYFWLYAAKQQVLRAKSHQPQRLGVQERELPVRGCVVHGGGRPGGVGQRIGPQPD